MSFGLTTQGFNRKRLADIKQRIESDLTDKFGAVNLGPDSVFGALVGIFSQVHSELWQELENVYYSQYTNSAEGTSLDNAVALVGVERLQAEKTTVIAAVTGNNNTVITAGSQVEMSETGDLFTNLQAGTITRTNALIILITTNTVANDTTYTVIINGTAISIDSGDSATQSSIITAIVDEINANIDNVTATDLGAGIFELRTDDYEETFNAAITNNFRITSVTSPLEFEAVETGPIEALEGTLNNIVTPISGWQSITNYLEGLTGRNLETDAELRLRTSQSLQVIGAASINAIRSNILQNVVGVTAAFIFENRTNSTDISGRPPHSFEVVVSGGADQDIADEIWRLKPAGIETYGTEELTVTDSNGDIQPVKFSRPVPVYIFIEVNITILVGTFPADGQDTIKANLASFGSNNFAVGNDVLYQQFYASIYSVGGVITANLTFGSSSDDETPPVSFSAANIAIAETELALFDEDRITVTIS